VKKMILSGRSECGKTTLRQALKGHKIQYEKTQYINHYDLVIDTPGEYAESKSLAHALALYSYEADVVALVCNATEPYTLFPPGLTCTVCRPLIGIVTAIDAEGANVELAKHWLKLSGANPIFAVSSFTGEGLWDLIQYLSEPGDDLVFADKEDAEKQRHIASTKYETQDIVQEGYNFI